jgi:hypothetical protein
MLICVGNKLAYYEWKLKEKNTRFTTKTTTARDLFYFHNTYDHHTVSPSRPEKFLNEGLGQSRWEPYQWQPGLRIDENPIICHFISNDLWGLLSGDNADGFADDYNCVTKPNDSITTFKREPHSKITFYFWIYLLDTFKFLFPLMPSFNYSNCFERLLKCQNFFPKCILIMKKKTGKIVRLSWYCWLNSLKERNPIQDEE